MASTRDKLTLSVKKEVARKARVISRNRKQSVSRMFEEWIMRISEDEDPLLALTGLWKDRDLTLDDLRARAWSRS